ncbi:16S rRNA (guanine(966)-N(2))-methyltransferase RsmD [Clostridium acetobutylicum]|uniref:N6-adenine-specific methylase n=1 Tax=Clostridium acetobutylicum (strain ATCC 824 / DSM 792 / JCM 1419 / IAM 19013 / LMG 5710 / NBRC 13948 / NRRL B-527 / VKM B-1787 / 2291 / W) TaxID=272562 RepID=Q97IB3_CLOAB|nr:MULTISPECIES: 16S rRNA (guanine(966)-N(2))-methyltransferase RsmD [Clostridium]AAK79703.1 N6-adenine-specific methylase [Clostridium acetobutylicum ATCC 824]ADZ20787.1 N6-adenine-specific methylase [Clostridium acetobutylicum EA 2018]AEI34066.1 N6-adenine-specific methylase [Clostridium acetobutylicum DSM 1731]AWV79862.1 16S rRNA (guanine(966)-N(2))-methyltransferase RsmD [Clostridium acetobutylicum]KHD38028.1 DNA methyltransferase [Clostridium acetobutylicum]
MRIISGKAKGRKILPPKGMETTRPTLDRVKEAMFNIIQNDVPEAVVLDMFSGTGSLGLEAASRGAKVCYLIDKSPITYPILKENVENLRFDEECKTLNMDSYEAVRYLASKGKEFTLIFIDPPYAKEMIPPAIDLICEKKLLTKSGLIVTKIDSDEKIYEGNNEIIMVDHRKYGKTIVCFYRYKEDKK